MAMHAEYLEKKLPEIRTI